MLERYWRLCGRITSKTNERDPSKISEEMRKSIQRERDILEDVIERADLYEVLRHKLVLEVLLG